uniref:Uncharacterized protein n=1 Tax=Arundo donax TaxID=35708 RepID=A0A0A9BLP1_ARUDO
MVASLQPVRLTARTPPVSPLQPVRLTVRVPQP